MDKQFNVKSKSSKDAVDFLKKNYNIPEFFTFQPIHNVTYLDLTNLMDKFANEMVSNLK